MSLTAEQFLEELECAPTSPSRADVGRLEQLFYEIPGNLAGGSMHIVCDDGNWDRSCVEFCRDYAIREGDIAGQRFAEWILASLTDEQLHEAFCNGYDENGVDYEGEHPCRKPAPA